MKRGRTVRYTFDVYSGGKHPSVGHVVRRVSYRGEVIGYLRVLSLRPVRVRVSRGEETRYRVELNWLDGMPEEGADVSMYDYPRVPRIGRPPRRTTAPPR